MRWRCLSKHCDDFEYLLQAVLQGLGQQVGGLPHGMWDKAKEKGFQSASLCIQNPPMTDQATG